MEDIEYYMRSYYDDIIETIAWATPSLEQIYPYPTRTRVSNVGRSHVFNHQIYAATSNFMDNVKPSSMSIGSVAEKRSVFKKSNGDSPIKQLYTSRTKMFSTVLSTGFRDAIEGEPNEPLDISVFPVNQETQAQNDLQQQA